MRGTRRPPNAGEGVRTCLIGHSNFLLKLFLPRPPRLPWDLMSDLGRYGRLAARHMARWQPSTYAAIPEADRLAYFQRLDDEVTEAIEERELSLKPPRSLQESDFLKYVGQMNMARLIAEEAVLAEMVYLPPEPGLESEADEAELDEAGAFIDRGWKSPALNEMSDEEWAESQAAGEWRPLRSPARGNETS